MLKAFSISASHCMQDKRETKRKSESEFYAYLGRYDFTKDEEFAKKINIEELYIHPSWKPDDPSYDSDLALLKTEFQIIFTRFIKPVCLPLFDAQVEEVSGYVAGYGKTESGNYETRPKHVKIKSVEQKVCLFQNPTFATISSQKMFCAGEKGRIPCQGDSGGGFYVQNGNKFEINGIVSAAASPDCNSEVYVAFTSIPDFVEWIREHIGAVGCKKDGSCIISVFDGSLTCTTSIQVGNDSDCKVILNDESNSKILRYSLLGGSALHLPDLTDIVQKFRNLQKVDLGFMGMKYIERRGIRIMKNINYVSFWGNQIDHLNDDTFADLTKLETLILGYNKLKILHKDIFANNVNLNELWLQLNQIEIIPDGLFRNNKKLKTIYLADNKFKRLKMDVRLIAGIKDIDFSEADCGDKCEVDMRLP
jgi:hypothetical protein